MKKILIKICGFYLFVTCSIAFGYPSWVTIVSSKITHSPDLQGGIIENKIQPNLNFSDKDIAYAKAMPAWGQRNQIIRVNGQYGFVIENKSNNTQFYNVEYKLILDDGRYLSRHDVIRLEKNATAQDNVGLFVYQLFPKVGSFRFSVETIVIGEQATFERDRNYIIIKS